MFESRYFRFTVWLFLILLIVLVSTQISFIFKPIVVLVQTFFLPIFLSGVLYFILSPLVNFLNRNNMSRGNSIWIIYLSVAIVLMFTMFAIGPILSQEIQDVEEKLPSFIDEIQAKFLEFQDNPLFERLSQIEAYSPEGLAKSFSEYLDVTISSIGSNVLSITIFVTNILMSLILVPFILFYMLKDGDKLTKLILKLLPEQHEDDAKRILIDMHDTLGRYIKGQLTVSFFVGIILYFGFLFGGLNYALLLAFIALITNIVPFIGPIIGTIPAIIIAITQSPFMAIYTLILIVVVQQIESLYISPRVMGNKLSLHPVLIIFIILFAGRFAGFVGIIIGVPAFAILRVFVIHGSRLLKLRKNV